MAQIRKKVIYSAIMVGILWLHPAYAETILYDEFVTGRIDPGKWSEMEFVREVDSARKRLVSKVGTDSGTAINTTRLSNPASRWIGCEINVLETDLVAGNGTYAVAGIGMAAYNSESSGGAVGDVYGVVGLVDFGDGLSARWKIDVAQDDEREQWTTFASGELIASGNLSFNTTINVSVEYIGGRDFRFIVDDQSHAASGPDRLRDVVAPETFLRTRIDSDSDYGEGYIHAEFDYVFRDGVLYDKLFDAPLDTSKWVEGEFVREVSDGKMRLGSHGCDQTANAQIGAFNDGDHASLLAAAVTVDSESMVSAGATAIARIAGFFYNDSFGPPSGNDFRKHLGDVWAELRIVLDDAGRLSVKALALRSDDSGFEDSTEIYSQDFAATPAFDTAYDMSIELTATQLVFDFAGESHAYAISGEKYEPYGKTPSLTARVYNDPTECGLVKAAFDRVIIERNKTLYDDFSAAPILPAKWMAFDGSKYDVARYVDTAEEDLKMAVDGCDGTQTITLEMKDPMNETNFLQADAKVETGSFMEPGVSGILRIGGFIYNSDDNAASYDGRLHDVWAETRIRLQDDGTLTAWAIAMRMDDPSMNTMSSLINEQFGFAAPLALDTFYTTSVALDESGDKLVFICNGESVEYSIATNIREPSSHYKQLASRVYGQSGKCGHVKGRFDNVYRAEGERASLFDDFSGSDIDTSTKWDQYHWAREIQNGRLAMQTSGCDQSIRNKNPLVKKISDYLSSKVRISADSAMETGVYAKSRLGGYMYNESGPPYNGYENDVYVQIFLMLDDQGDLTAQADVWRSDSADESTGTSLFNHDFGAVDFDIDYPLSIRLTGDSLVFACGLQSAAYNLQSPAYPPHEKFKVAEHRLYGVPGACGFLKGDFDDFKTRFCDLWPVKLSYGSETMYSDEILAGYLHTVDGGALRIQEAFFREALDFNLNKNIVLEGGLSCDFSSEQGFTAVAGPVTISAGSVTVENLQILP